MADRSGGQRLEHHPRIPWLLVDAAQSVVRSLAVAAAARRPISTPSTWPQVVVLRSRGPGGVWPCRSESSALKTDAGGMAQAWPMRTMPAFDGPGGGHDPWHHDGRPLRGVATSCAPFDGRVCLASLDLLGARRRGRRLRLALIRERSSQLWLGLQAIQGWKTLLQEPPPAVLVSVELEGRWPGHRRNLLVGTLGPAGSLLRSLDSPPLSAGLTHLTHHSEEVGKLLAPFKPFFFFPLSPLAVLPDGCQALVSVRGCSGSNIA